MDMMMMMILMQSLQVGVFFTCVSSDLHFYFVSSAGLFWLKGSLDHLSLTDGAFVLCLFLSLLCGAGF